MPAIDDLIREIEIVPDASTQGRRRTKQAVVPPLAAFAAVAVVLVISGLTRWHRHTVTEEHPSASGNGPSASIATASAEDDRVVRQFIQRLRHEATDFSPVADWTGGRLVLAVPDPASSPWPSVDGNIIGGLHVTVLKAAVSIEDYDHAISTIGRATFVDSNTIQSYDYPTDGSHIIVRVHGLADMDAARRAALAANLERVSGVNVELIQAIRMTSLVSHAPR